MRLLHVADLHIGKVVNGFPLIDDQRFILSQIISLAKKHRADALLLAGDLYDKSTPSAETVTMLDWFFSEIAEARLNCVAIPGNHDSAERVAYASGSLARQGIYVSPLFDGSIRSIALDDKHGTVKFWLLPFLKPAQIRPYFPDAEIGTDYTAAVRTILESCEVNPKERNVLLCHQFVVAGDQLPLLSDSEIVVGGLDSVDASVFEAFDYVALGHLHRPQRIGRDTVRYAGSPLKYSASEASVDKSATLVELGEKADGACAVHLSAVPLSPLRDMRHIKGPLAKLCSNEVAKGQSTDDYLHVTLTDSEPVIDALARLRAVYPNVMSLDYQPDGLEGITTDRTLPPDELETDPLELFARFFEDQTGTKLTDEQRKIIDESMEEVR